MQGGGQRAEIMIVLIIINELPCLLLILTNQGNGKIVKEEEKELHEDLIRCFVPLLII